MLEINLAKIVRNLPGGKKEVFPMVGTVPGEGVMPGEPGKDGQDGQDGKDGKDGRSPYIGADGYWYQYDDAQGKYVKTNTKAQGEGSGSDGGYYTPSVATNGDLSWTASKSGMPSVSTVNIRGPQGPAGSGDGGSLFPTPLNYGAVGDGLADDTAAVQACLDANAVVRFPAGKVFRITSPLQVGRSSVCIMGDNAKYTALGGLLALDPTEEKTAAQRAYSLRAVAESMSVLYADFSTDGYAIEVKATSEVLNANGNPAGPLRVTIRDLMIYGRYYTCTVNSTTNGTVCTETRDSVIVGGIDARAKTDILRCGFVGLSGAAVNIQARHSELGDLAFRKCYTCVQHTDIDHIFHNIWISCCHDGFVSTLAENMADGLSPHSHKYKFDNIWIDQCVGDFIRFSKLQTVMISNCWCDLIGGHFLYMPTTPVQMPERVDGETVVHDQLRGFITGTRINRTNQKTGEASIVAALSWEFYAQITSEEATYNKLVLKPLFYLPNGFHNSMVIAPGRSAILHADTGVQSGNQIFGTAGPY